MQSNQAQKPEYVLKRANDLINTSTSATGEEKRWALELLHNFIGGKKKVSQWSKLYEQIMKRHVELCIDLKNHHFAKDGLHQYRNLCQLTDPGSLEVVILHLLDLTEAQAVAARSRVMEGAALITDLDQEESPESIMLSTMTEEGDKERSTRELVVPWLKFLWETYRAVLELLYKMPKLEKVYHKTCEKAFKFCQDYERKIEFKRLCEMLRLHLLSLQKTAATPATGRNPRTSWDWTSESVDFHLQTRFLQLETATTLELWNEGFRTVEDIYSIMQQAGRKSSRSRLMAVYYEKLTRIFWVSENYLFHAYAWFRFYSLVSESRKDLKAEEKSVLASCVLLSALSVPSLRDADAVSTTGNVVLTNSLQTNDEDDMASEKQQQMATLLDFQANPTRKALLAEILAKGVVADVLPELAGLFDDMEVKFQPLTLARNIVKAIQHIKTIPQLAVYALPLQRVAVFKVVQQLSKVYDVVKLSFLRKILEGLEDISPNSVERLMIDGVIRKQLQLRIDHVAQCVRFGASVLNEAVIVETQVQIFGTKLQEVGRLVSSITKTPESEAAKVAARKDFIAKIRETADKEHSQALERKNIIEQRKIEVDRVQEERERIAVMMNEAELARQQAEEQARLDKERLAREEKKAKEQQEKDECKRIKLDLQRLGQVYEEADLLAMPPEKRNSLVTNALQEAQRAKEEQERKLQEQAKKLDHITRALRIESAEKIRKNMEEQAAADKIAHEETVRKFLVESREKHAKELEIKKQWQPLQQHRAVFDQHIIAAQRAQYDRELAVLRQRALAEHRAGKVARARQQWDEEMQRLEEEEELARERKDKEERDRIEQEQYESILRRRMEEEEAERARQREKEAQKAEQAKALEQARLAKLSEAKKAQQAASAAPAPAAAAPSAPATGGSGWARGGATLGGGAAAATAFAEKEKEGAAGPSRFGDRSGGDRDRPRFGDRAGTEPSGGARFERSGGGGSFERSGDRPERSDRGGFGDRSSGGAAFERGGARPSDRGFGGDRDRAGGSGGGFGDRSSGGAPKDSGSSWSRGSAPAPRPAPSAGSAGGPPAGPAAGGPPADNERWSTAGPRGETRERDFNRDKKPSTSTEGDSKWSRGGKK